jgi:hypothetical protein
MASLLGILQGLKLEAYAATFEENGYDDADLICNNMSAEDTDDMIASVFTKPGHALKFRNFLRNKRADIISGPEEPQTAAVPAAAAAAAPVPQTADQIRFKEELTAIYEKYNPSKIDEIDGLLSTYIGREDALLAAVARKYVASGGSDPCGVPTNESSLCSRPASVTLLPLFQVPAHLRRRSERPDLARGDENSGGAP